MYSNLLVKNKERIKTFIKDIFPNVDDESSEE